MGTIIARDKLESMAYSNVFEILNTRSYINDPRNSGNTSNKVRQLIYDYDPFHRSVDFELFPYIILELPTLTYDNISGDGKSKNIGWRHTVLIRTTRLGASNTTVDTGRSDMLDMCDDMNETFNKETVKSWFRLKNMRMLILTKLRSDFAIVDQKPVYESEYSLEYFTRLQVSA
jgi:hypothetical protein